MSIECCQRSPSLPSSSSPPMHSSLGGGQSSVVEQYTFLVPADVGSNSQQRTSRMLRTDAGGTESGTGTQPANINRPQVPPRPVGSKPVPPPRHSSTSTSSSTLTSNNTSTTTNTATTSSSSFEPPPRIVNKQSISEPSGQSSPIITETTGSVSHASTSGSSTPPVIRWGKNFDDLISDKKGFDLFSEFLRKEAELEDLIKFFLICKAIKYQENRPRVARLAGAIIRKYILESNSVGRYLSEEVKSKLVQINKKINESKVERYTDEFYMNLFNEAQAEIYNHLSSNLYQNFIRHDIYLRHLNEITYNNEQTTVYSEAANAETTPSPSNESLFEGTSSLDIETQVPPSYDSLRQVESPYNYGFNPKTFALSSKKLPTLCEQDETSSTVDLKSDDEVATTFAVYDKSTTASGYFSCDSGVGTQVSQISTMSLERTRNRNHSSGKSRSHSPIVGPTSSTLNRGGVRQFQSSPYRADMIGDGIQYEGNEVKLINNQKKSKSYFPMQQMDLGAPNPYHVNTFTIVQPSARDSEIQSISSNSTSESYRFRDRSSSNHHTKLSGTRGTIASGPDASKGSLNLPPNDLRNALNGLQKQHTMQINCTTKQITAGLKPKGPDPTQNPEAFSKLLCDKLRPLVIESEKMAQFAQKIRDIDKDPGSGNGLQGLKDALKNKKFGLQLPDDKDDQSILDNHCAQVFDMTPSNSGTPTTATALQPPSQAQVAAQVYGGSVNSANRAAAYHHHHYQQSAFTAHRPVALPPSAVPPVHYSMNRSHVQPALLNSTPNYPFGPSHPTIPHLAHASTGLPKVSVTVLFSDDECPYKLTLDGPNVTLAEFKAAIPTKKGKVYKHCFTRKCTPEEIRESGYQSIKEFIDDENAILPQCDGKIFAQGHLQGI